MALAAAIQLRALAFGLGLLSLAGCALAEPASSDEAAIAARPEPAAVAPVTTEPWAEAMASVTDLDRSARFFREVGGYRTLARGPLDPAEIAAWGLPETASGEALVLAAPGAEHGFVRLVRFDGVGPKTPTRPGARAWDTGCFWSIMVRMKDMERVFDDAIALGWWSETPITYLEFGPSKLHVVVLRGPDGVQVQGYERLASPLPEGFAPFERISQPFNIMQMARDREAARVLMEDVLGFDRFFYGPPQLEAEPTDMPLGIPRNLTTTVPYLAGIFYPVPGEYGRMEYIEIDGLEGRDHAERCNAPNLGVLSVSYPVENVEAALRAIEERGWPIEAPIQRIRRAPYGTIEAFRIKSPDGANIEFFAPASYPASD